MAGARAQLQRARAPLEILPSPVVARVCPDPPPGIPVRDREPTVRASMHTINRAFWVARQRSQFSRPFPFVERSCTGGMAAMQTVLPVADVGRFRELALACAREHGVDAETLGAMRE